MSWPWCEGIENINVLHNIDNGHSGNNMKGLMNETG